MEQYEHSAALSGEAQIDVKESFPEKEALSFAILLERFFQMNNVYPDMNTPAQVQNPVRSF